MDNKPKPLTLNTVRSGGSDPEATERLKKTLERFMQMGDQSSIKSQRMNGKPILKRIK